MNRHRWSPCGRSLAALAMALFLLHVAPVQAEPPACPAEVVTCCDISGVSSSAPDRRLQMGLQIWLENADAVARRLRELRPTAVRYSGGPNWRRAPTLDSNADYEAVRRYVVDALEKEAAQVRKQTASLKEIFDGLGAEAHFVIWEPPPTKAEASEPSRAPDKRTLPDAAVPVTAMFYVALLDELRRRGYPIDVVELSNEPDGGWNINIPPARYLKLVTETRRQAKAHGVTLPRIAGPGVSNISALQRYFADPALAKGLVGSVDLVSVHAWDDRLNRDTVAEARNARRQLDKFGYHKAILVSEFALTFVGPTDRGRGIGANRRAPEAISNQPSYAAKTLALALELAADGYGPLLYWELSDTSWGKASYGLYNERGEPRPALEPWRNLSRIARQADRVRVVPLVPNVIFGLVRDDKIAAIAVVNASAKPLGIAIRENLDVAASLQRQQGKLADCTGGAHGTKSLQPNGIAVLELN